MVWACYVMCYISFLIEIFYNFIHEVCAFVRYVNICYTIPEIYAVILVIVKFGVTFIVLVVLLHLSHPYFGFYLKSVWVY